MKILIGIQPTGKLHLGNYLGCIKKGIELQKDNDVIFLIAHYHALTSQNINIEKLDKSLFKLGVENIEMQQSENIELAWRIMCKTPVSELKKMTQWKDKGQGNAGLLTYPCLMAADIIIERPDFVLIGEDQLQHMEFYRKTCKRLGIKKIAKNMLTETSRIMSIKDPSKKMSKTLGDEHCVYLFEDNTKKIMKAPTTPDGIRNLKLIANGLGITFDENDCKKSKQEILKKLINI
jgi:tryptophanyl-tRNA synthetase